MYVEDAILMAGGFVDDAEKTVVNINRLDRDVNKGTYSKLITYAIDREYLLGLKKRPSNPFILKNKDIITVYAPIRAKFQPTISVEGEVKFPRNIILESDQVSVRKDNCACWWFDEQLKSRKLLHCSRQFEGDF